MPSDRLTLRPGRRARGHRTEFWQALNKILGVLLAMGIIVMMVLWFYPEVERRNELAKNLTDKEDFLKSEQLKRKLQEREVYLLENDPEYIETIARDKLDLMKEGETIFRLDSKAPHPVQELPAALPVATP
jgi:cell division protein FtsB